jgi:hypothetical protein
MIQVKFALAIVPLPRHDRTPDRCLQKGFVAALEPAFGPARRG